MIDDLDLAFEEHADRGRHRHRRSARRRQQRPRKRRGRSWLAFVLVLVLLGGLAGAVWWGFDRIEGFFTTPDYNSAGTGEVTIEIKKGETLTDVANTLYGAGVIKSAKAFIEAADKNPRSRNIAPGVYKVRKQMRAADALALLLGDTSRLVTKVTIPEGRTAIQTYKILADKTKLPYDSFVNAAKDPVKLGVPELWFVRKDGKPVVKSIEGFLYPATYDFDPGMTAEQILRRMVGEFVAVTTQLKFVETVERDRGNIAPYEALIMASLAQSEAGVAEDIPKIVRVIINRVYAKEMALEFDTGVNYYWELTGKPTKASKDMTEAELKDPKNPYATHVHKGLTPTPINNPGTVALQGVMSPPAGSWLFFVAIDKAGHSAFATTDQEHEANKRIACRNGVLTC